MGLGLFQGGLGVTRHLVGLGYQVTVTDLKDADKLRPSVEALAGTPVRLVLGRHDVRDFTDTDLVVVNPAVPPGNEYVAAARSAGVPLDTEIGMFVRGCRERGARILGITGSAGKSTTSALAAACLTRAALPGRVRLGGNIGRSLLDEIPSIAREDVVVLELSSFQLHWLRRDPSCPGGLRPDVGVLTNVAPNHLDWHGTIEEYAADKSGIVPAASGTLVALAADPVVRGFAAAAPCRVVWTGSTALDVPAHGDAVYWRDRTLVRRSGGAGGGECEILTRDDVHILGEHAAWNVASAAAAVSEMGAAPAAIREGVRSFDGLPHRLKPIGTVRGVLCVDDSKSTTPESAAAALRAFDRPVLLLAGGYDKHADPGPMVAAAAGRARVVVCYGATGPSLCERFREAGIDDVLLVTTLEEAVDAAMALADPGDVLLLSPGHASWDQFANYEARARSFAESLAAVG